MFHIFVVVALLMAFASTAEDSDRSAPLALQRRKTFAALVFSTNNVFFNSSDKNVSCQWLSRLKHQSKLCWRRRGLAETLLFARRVAVKYCEESFRYDQWNCSNPERFLKKIYRETAFMYSIASSALMYSIARSCAEGTLAGCKCGDHGKAAGTKEWQWGGCGDNIKYGRRFAKKFLQLKRKDDHGDLNPILRVNSELGIKVAAESDEKVCRCHGVSGSCSVKICWKQIKPFEVISEKLKNLYHNAIQLEAKNSVRSVSSAKEKGAKRKLLYLESSPNFCPATVNRRCKNTENCATLCCARGFYTEVVNVVEQCRCSWRDIEKYKVQCDECVKEEQIFKCK